MFLEDQLTDISLVLGLIQLRATGGNGFWPSGGLINLIKYLKEVVKKEYFFEKDLIKPKSEYH